VIDGEGHVIVEGTQGFALSLLHGAVYPFVTSRDTTAAGFAMEVGLSPRLVDEIVMVIRTYPIRVGGPSGPFDNETTWDDVAFRSGAPEVFPEYTSVTKRLRRVALFDLKGVKLACEYNRPTSLAVMGLDRIDFRNQGATDHGVLTDQAKRFMDELETSTRVPISIAGTGFGTFDAIILDSHAVETGSAKAESAYA
jgi:adenylosuccinate synthase